MACIRLETQPFIGPGCRPTEGLVGPQAVHGLGPKAYIREELDRGGTPALINRFRRPSASEVGLNIHRCQPQPFGPGWCHQPGRMSPFRPGWWHQPGLKAPLWSRFVPPTGTKGLSFPPLELAKNTFGPGWWFEPGPKGGL